MKNGKERRTTSMRIRLTADELSQIKAKADSFGLSMSEYIRLVTIRGKVGRPKNSGRYTKRIIPKIRFRLVAEKPLPTKSADNQS